jgi:succinoglycan biosynthesis transport protein ExoP
MEQNFSRIPSQSSTGLSRLPLRTYMAYPSLAAEPAPAGLETESLFDYVRILISNYKALLLAMLIGILAAVAVTLPEAPVYRARTTLEIQSLNNEFLNNKQASPGGDDASPASIIADIQTQIKIIDSEFLVDRVVDRLKQNGKLDCLRKNGERSLIESLFHKSDRVPADAAIAQFRANAFKNLTVSQISQTRVIEVLFKAPDAHLAADFVNTLDSEYIESNIEARWKMSERTSLWLGRQLDDTRAKLERSELNLQDYARRVGLVFTASDDMGKANIAEEKLRELQSAVSRAQEVRSAAQSRYETAQAATPESLADVLDNQTLRDLQRQITDLRRQQAEMNSLFTPKYEKVKLIEVQIAPLEEAFNKERTAVLGRIRTDYKTALRNEQLLRADYKTQAVVLSDQADKSIQYGILKRDVDSNRQLYESMLQQFKASSVASVMRASNIRIIDPGKAPTGPYSPNLTINVLLGLIAGLVFGVAFVLIRRSVDVTFQQPGDVNLWTGLPMLGVIPAKSLTAGPRKFGFLEKVGFRPATATNGIVAEAFRTVLTSILFSGHNGIVPRVLVLTSPDPEDGKTTVTVNLAIALAEIRLRVVIVDADLRKPRVHEVFNVKNDCGLSNLLNVETVAAEAVSNLVQGTSTPGIYVLPSGPLDGANLLHSPHLDTILKELRNQFDMVLIDTPPATQLPDSRIVGKFSDGIILITRAGSTTRDAAGAVVRRFMDDRTPLLGAILNNWKPIGRSQTLRYYEQYTRQNDNASTAIVEASQS